VFVSPLDHLLGTRFWEGERGNLIVIRKVKVVPVFKEVPLLTSEPIPFYTFTPISSKIVSTVSSYKCLITQMVSVFIVILNEQQCAYVAANLFTPCKKGRLCLGMSEDNAFITKLLDLKERVIRRRIINAMSSLIAHTIHLILFWNL
jgi:hypothetical protein